MKKHRVVHLVEDAYWIDGVADVFEGKEGVENQYIVVGAGRSRATRAKLSSKFEYYDCDSFFESGTPIDGGVALVVSHGINKIKAKVICACPSHVPVMWVIMGADFYSSTGLWGRSILRPKTRCIKAFFQGIRIPRRIFRGFLSGRRLLSNVGARVLGHGSCAGSVSDALWRVDYVGTFQEWQVEYLKHVRGIREDVEWVFFSYYSTKRLFSGGEIMARNNGVVVGNSATFTNNHIDILLSIKRVHVSGTPIVLPLVYGDAGYARFLVAVGKMLFGKDFKCLTAPEGLQAYNQLVGGYLFAVMGQFRGQAVGLMLSLFYHGTKIFLSVRNPLLKVFREWGLIVYSIEKDLVSSGFGAPLSYLERVENRNIVARIFNRDYWTWGGVEDAVVLGREVKR